MKRSNFVDFELAERGQNFLISCEGVLFSSGVFRLHRCFFKYPVLREGVYPSGDLERISGSLAKLEKMGCDLAKVADALGRLVGNLEGATQEAPQTGGEEGKSYVS